jgi:nicotinamidase-related amidase
MNREVRMPPENNDDLDGNAPDNSPVALLIIDMISDFEFKDSDQLFRFVPQVARNIAALKKRANQAGVPVIYVNDNYGKWQSDFNRLVEHCLKGPGRGREVVELLMPAEEDYFVLKPKHSGFFSTTLELLLTYLKVKTLILTGVAGNICILFTASDAYIRDYTVIIPPDCVASNTSARNDQALDLMKTVLDARLIVSTELDWEEGKGKRRTGNSTPSSH